MKRYLQVGDCCQQCNTPRVDISHETLRKIQRELSPSIKSIPARVLAKGREVYAICPRCDLYALGLDLQHGYPFTEADGRTTTIHELTERPEWGW